MSKLYFDLVEFYNQFNGHGNGAIIKGRVRVGKTYLIGIIAKLLLNCGFYIISNVRFTDSEFEKYKGKLFYVRSDLDVFKSYLSIPKDTKILLIFDDSQASEGFKSTHVIRKSGDSLQTFLIFMGKLEMNYLIIMHNYLIPYTLIDGFEPIFIYKFDRNNFYVAKEYYETKSEIFSNSFQIPIPDIDKFSGLEILSKAIAVFEWKLDLRDMFSYVADYKYGENLRQGIKDYLDEHENDYELQSLKKLTWSDIAMAIKLKNPKVKGSDKLYEIINPNVLYSAFNKVK